MAIKKLFSKINNHRSSKTGITTTHHRDNEKCEIVPSHPSSLTDAASTPDMRNKKKKSSSTKKWRKKFSLPSGSSWTTYANNNNSSNTPRRRNSLVAFTPSGSLPCFRAGSTTDPTTVTTSSASFADHDYNDVDELPLPQRPFSCSTVIMPDILHALRSNDKDPHEDNYNEHEEQLMTVDESSSFASRYCIASSSKFQQSSICSAVGQHVVSPSMHAAPSCSSAPASSIDSKTAAPTTTTSTPPETCYKSVTHNEKIELTPPFLPSSPPPSTTDLAAIASVDHHSSSQQDVLAPGGSKSSAMIAKLQVDKTVAEMRLAQSTRSLQGAMQEIKFLKNRIKYLETQDVEAEDLLRMHTRAQLGLIEYLEGEDDLAIALERFKRQLMESDEEQSSQHQQQQQQQQKDNGPVPPSSSSSASAQQQSSLPTSKEADRDNPY